MAKSVKKILIIEDELPLAKALSLKLKKSGFSPVVAPNGEQALQLLLTEKFGLIVLDLVMPKVDGFLVLEELRARGDTTPVIVTSNLSQAEDIKRVKELGAKEYFVKSDTPISKLVGYIKDTLRV